MSEFKNVVPSCRCGEFSLLTTSLLGTAVPLLTTRRPTCRTSVVTIASIRL